MEIAVAAGVGIFVWMFFVYKRKLKRQKAFLQQRRPNPTRDEFITLLAPDCEADIADQLWNDLLVFYQPDMTPHPDDDAIQDMLVDPDEPNDWLGHFCRSNGLRIKDVSPWPDGQLVTIRNLARWFSDNRRRLSTPPR